MTIRYVSGKHADEHGIQLHIRNIIRNMVVQHESMNLYIRM